MKDLRVLVVSHNVFSRENNMGRSLAGLLSGWDPDALSQLYFCPEQPSLPLCRRYFRVTDLDALRSLWRRRGQGQALPVDGAAGRVKPPPPAGWVYRLGHSCRTPLLGLLRDGLWALALWDSPQLQAFLAEARPDVILFAAGDAVFSNRIVCRLAARYRLPVVTVSYDDFYSKPRFSLFGTLHYRLRMGWARRIIRGGAGLLVASPAMAEAYAPVFQVPCLPVYTSYAAVRPFSGRPGGVRYFGNLGLGRWRQLISIGRALAALRLPGLPPYLEVYSQEDCPHIRKKMLACPGIRFCGGISGSRVARLVSQSLVVIHTESFAPREVRRIRFSLSTKLADYLAFAPCILAYGPEEAASIAYLRDHRAAVIVSSERELSQGLVDACTQEARRAEVRTNARELAAEHHDPIQVSKQMRAVLARAVAAWKGDEE